MLFDIPRRLQSDVRQPLCEGCSEGLGTPVGEDRATARAPACSVGLREWMRGVRPESCEALGILDEPFQPTEQQLEWAASVVDRSDSDRSGAGQ